MKSIKFIRELIQTLSESEKSNYDYILNSFDFNSINFKPFESWSDKKYTRNCIYRDERFELLLLCWQEGQQTSIHGHDGEDCWVFLLEGKMQEMFYAMDDQGNVFETNSQTITPGEKTFMNDQIGFHRLANTNNGKTISLHLYAKPIENCSFYDEHSNEFVRKKLQYDTVQEDLLMTSVD
ncbi:cysteine dioxygenase family protein [Psychroserpens sp. XS_ASV72]|uniref:cysteine dioxygenase n=1 Tax=Psychroserpens sp. XS_ASV72 TaxID=3241293 RepID=UPI0035185C1F